MEPISYALSIWRQYDNESFSSWRGAYQTNTMYWKILSSSSSLVFGMMVDAAVILSVDIGNVVVSLFSVELMLSIAIGTWNWSNNWAKNTGMMDFRSANVNTRKPSTMQLLQNILNNAIFNCGLPFFLLARISSFSHSLRMVMKQYLINFLSINFFHYHKIFMTSSLKNLIQFCQMMMMTMPRRHEKVYETKPMKLRLYCVDWKRQRLQDTQNCFSTLKKIRIRDERARRDEGKR